MLAGQANRPPKCKMVYLADKRGVNHLFIGVGYPPVALHLMVVDPPTPARPPGGGSLIFPLPAGKGAGGMGENVKPLFIVVLPIHQLIKTFSDYLA
jgi:hypothetical protein